MSHVIAEKKGKVGYITLNRSSKGNALNNAFILKLTQAIVSFNHDKDIVVIVLKSSGKNFCIGADQTYLEEVMQYSHHENIKDSFDLMKLYKAVYLSPKITISQINGFAFSGGAILAINTDFSFSSPNAVYGFNESKVGFIPGIALNFLRKKIGVAQMKKMIFTSQKLNALQAHTFGLITDITTENLDEYTQQFIKELLQNNSHQSLLATKEVLVNSEKMEFEDALAYSATMNASARETKDSRKGVEAFLMSEDVDW